MATFLYFLWEKTSLISALKPEHNLKVQLQITPAEPIQELLSQIIPNFVFLLAQVPFFGHEFALSLSSSNKESIKMIVCCEIRGH